MSCKRARSVLRWYRTIDIVSNAAVPISSIVYRSDTAHTHTLRSMYSTNEILATSFHIWIALIMMLWNRKVLGLWPHVSSLSLVNVPVVQRVLAVLTFIYQFLNNKTFKETFVDGLTFSSPEPFLSPFSRVSSTQKINTLPKNFYVKILQMIQPGRLLFNSQWPLSHTTLFKHKWAHRLDKF